MAAGPLSFRVHKYNIHPCVFPKNIRVRGTHISNRCPPPPPSLHLRYHIRHPNSQLLPVITTLKKTECQTALSRGYEKHVPVVRLGSRSRTASGGELV